jgi:hypothetical protein
MWSENGCFGIAQTWTSDTSGVHDWDNSPGKTERKDFPPRCPKFGFFLQLC